jgi:uncharacterized protein YkwD
MARPRRWVQVLVATGALAVVGAGCFPAGPPAATGSCGMDATSSAVLTDLNITRADAGLPPLAANGQLTCLAQGWSGYLASVNGFFHRDLASVIRSPGYGGYHTLGENILEGPASMTANEMNTAWFNSPEHRANMLSGAFTSVGIGVGHANGSVWATEDFGG